MCKMRSRRTLNGHEISRISNKKPLTRSGCIKWMRRTASAGLRKATIRMLFAIAAVVIGAGKLNCTLSSEKRVFR